MNRRRFSAWLAALPFGAAAASAVAEDAKQAEPPKKPSDEAERKKLEKALAEKLSGASLVGFYTENGAEAKTKLLAETYKLGEVKKLPEGDLWSFVYRYGESGLPIPLPALEIKWAGDTPVIVLTDMAIPGLGKFTSRVLFYGDEYCGTWSGGPDHGGKLFGKIVPPSANKDGNAKKKE